MSVFFFSSRRRHTRWNCDWSSDVCSSDLIGLNCQDVVLGTGAHVRCLGKGRKQRCTPLRPETAKMVDAWLRECHGQPEDPVFPSIRGDRLSRDAIECLLTKYAQLAARSCPS